MKTFLAIVLLATALFFWQRSHQQPVSTTPETSGTASPSDKAIAGAHVSPAPLLTPRPASEQNWIKRPIDRAHEVADQVRKRSEETQQP